jgi:hypothetical protein
MCWELFSKSKLCNGHPESKREENELEKEKEKKQNETISSAVLTIRSLRTGSA